MQNLTEVNSNNHWLVDFVGALVCGFVVGAFQQRTADSGEFYLDSFVRCVLLAIGSYSIVALLLPLWKSRPFRRVANWLFIIVLGSAIFYFCIHLVDTVTYAIRFRYTQPELRLSQYILSYVQEFAFGLIAITIIDSILALPIMGAIHYFGVKNFGRVHLNSRLR
jgi:tryptophan-rich sensory protein